MSEKCNIPVLFLVFNRLDTTKQVFEAIRKAAPPRLYVASDGPRDNREGEKEKVEEVRDYVLKSIDWDCEVKTLFREKNVGCGKAVSGAITWFFEREEMGIILEDDCLPVQSFFRYCEELLKYYKNDERVFLISGLNRQGMWNQDKYDYFFSNLGGIWGWASWARAWKYYDYDMSDIEDFIQNNGFENLFGKRLGRIRQRNIYSEIKIKKIDTWDYQWAYTRHKNNGLACVPSKNLITNIGFGTDATHTKIKMDQPDTYEFSFPLKKNNFLIPDHIYDEIFFEQKIFIIRVINKIKRLFLNYL